MTFDRVLKSAKADCRRGCHLICYADDTLVLVKNGSPREAVVKANFCVVKVIRVINSLGLEVAAGKTEAMLFSKNRANTESLAISIDGQLVSVQDSIKYLGVIIDSAWDFRGHFRYIEEKASGVMQSLWRIMPNIRGPGETKKGFTLTSSIPSSSTPLLSGVRDWLSQSHCRPPLNDYKRA